MNPKYARFFTVGGQMQWDSIKDDADLNSRIVASLEQDERDQFREERSALNRVGGWVMLPFALIVRVA